MISSSYSQRTLAEGISWERSSGFLVKILPWADRQKILATGRGENTWWETSRPGHSPFSEYSPVPSPWVSTEIVGGGVRSLDTASGSEVAGARLN